MSSETGSPGGPRFAVYFRPPENHPLTRTLDAWLDCPELSGLADLDSAVLDEITAAPRHYGLHATLKPPFHLAPPATPAELSRLAQEFAAHRPAFAIPLVVGAVGSFLALVEGEPSPEMHDLAAAAVRGFEPLRAPETPAQRAARVKPGMTPRQLAYLEDWGYPYLFEEFRFHVSLTGRIADPELRQRVRAALEHRLAPLLAEPIPVDDVCLFRQPERTSPFRLLSRHPLLG